MHKYGFPSLIRTLAKDATKYFLVIFTAHLVLAGKWLSQGPDRRSDEVRYTVISGNTKDNARVDAMDVELSLEMVKCITIQDWN